ncbi:exopolysaccharide biosynthesis protein [Aureimonas ureilytica]|uniref:Exopolysaccharide biosynthesis protein n=1 Tax=Aureimonas ureilytica TaxID=401562 RepID=A0A147DAX8_9HYPH|nr:MULTISPECIES: exopolysaccharide biosynthesis polyprenyl glycosylphosphotransferase [Aureimonas]KTQ98700.1 exopolysaccharide biosynthesis protein [Aureimonas ureilytica]KTR08104.1 exopolysaccharide biosynthesis protein [Aureimonas ureilytica]
MTKLSSLAEISKDVPALGYAPVGGHAKRSLDILIAVTALILLSPLMLFIIVLMKITDPGPIFFGHKRVGFDGQHFPCYKFRSMATNSAELLQKLLQSDPVAKAEWEASQKLRNDPRVTRIGRILRETSLDELPQLFNVLKGDMSLVGPRPIVDDEIPRYSHRISAYKRVRPGVTGMWQVNGRSDTSYAARVKFDSYYVRNWSVLLDLRILFKTVGVVLKRDGSY